MEMSENAFTEAEAVEMAKQYCNAKLGWSKHTWDVVVIRVAKGDLWTIRFEQAFRTVVVTVDPQRREIINHTTELG